jgi:hypothetical protein
MKTDRQSRRVRKAPFLTSLALGCALMTGSAGAGIPVTDVGNMPNHIITQIQSYLNQLNTYTQRAQDYKQYADMIINPGQAFQMAQLSFGAAQFQKRNEMEGVSERCRGSGSGSMIGELFTAVGLNPNGDIIAEQRRICTMIVVLENKKYNDSVDAMNKLLNDTQTEINTQANRLLSTNRQGDTQTLQANATNGLQTILTNHQQTQERMKMYDDLINVLKESQKALAVRALKGESTPLSTMTNTLILAGALSLTD